MGKSKHFFNFKFLRLVVVACEKLSPLLIITLLSVSAAFMVGCALENYELEVKADP